MHAAADWTWDYTDYDPDSEGGREALLTLANGVFGTRGSCSATDSKTGSVHYPGTYMAGCFDHVEETVEGRRVHVEERVNLPNWLILRLRILPADSPPGPWLTPDTSAVEVYRQTLMMRTGLLRRTMRLTDADGRRTLIQEVRLVHMTRPHLALLRLHVRNENWNGTLQLESALDATVTNNQVERYGHLSGQHLTATETGQTDPTQPLWLTTQTTGSNTAIALAARTRLRPPELQRISAGHLVRAPGRIAQRYDVPLEPGQFLTVDKTVSLHTSSHLSYDGLRHAALRSVQSAPAPAQLVAEHRRAWHLLWRKAGDPAARNASTPAPSSPQQRTSHRLRRLYLFHLLQSCSPHCRRLDTGIASRGLHGEEYRGRIFWDEVFVMPWLASHFPHTARAALDYRHRRLPAACRAAAAIGARGAMYPWQSGRDGAETTVPFVMNPADRQWLPDNSALQRHVSSAVALSVHTYVRASGDISYAHGRGAEMILQIARFWADTARHDARDNRYHIDGVMGPDEFHDAYPEADTAGLRDNAYTNVTASWVLAKATTLWADLPAARREELVDLLRLSPEEPERWETISHRLHVPFHHGIISQFAGWEDLDPFNWDAYRRRHGNLQRLDRILAAEGDHTNRYQAVKQADVLMLGYLFDTTELPAQFARLGYRLSADNWRDTVDHYLTRTVHGSTLSPCVHARVLGRIGHSDASHFRSLAGAVDVHPDQDPRYGIHLGAMAAALDTWTDRTPVSTPPLVPAAQPSTTTGPGSDAK
ncbi:glycoside hydrolase family 65 protein [Streptomyces sp. NPDC058193]|uniref:glycoside hydrolase family 65 protein n=1 Tax=Streptomyces sp. NPDC058193 TaxID=3346373 RepID=UPI0036E62A62